MKKVRITQIKSEINRPKRQKRTLVALGLKKLHQPKEHEATPQILGMIEKVKHLLKVEEIK
ncbi:MAG: 50S ribosomal protein L30 [Bacteroidetes bacterium]|nr:MAG: 50S ribosomal protein L30 [Bacteroidota bacterium]RLD74574.1 MAG: 50S ribosomal protein L30 [Bacteroidota bacterium]RLD89656.1 MAG: 50S ribosomal protein L30 [Bacteroidota bacterium]